MSRSCRGISLHLKDHVADPVLEFDRVIARYALKTFGPLRSCDVRWSETDGTWYYDIHAEFHGASLNMVFCYENRIVELVASAPLNEKTARELLVKEEAPDEPDWSARDKNVETDRHGITWKTSSTDNFSQALGYRGASLVGLRAEVGS